MKLKLTIAALLICLVGVLVLHATQNTKPRSLRIGVFLLAQHPVIEEIAAGFKGQMNDLAAKNGTKLDYIERNADGQAAQATSIASYFRTADVDCVFVVGLPAAQSLKAAGVKCPVILGGPPDPVGAGLVSKLAHHGTNFTGTRYLPPFDVILDVLGHAMPKAKKLAVLHNPGEENSMAVVRPFLSSARKRGFVVRDLGINTPAEIESALQVLASDKPDAVFIPNDNMIYSALDHVIVRANESGIPAFGCSKACVKKGAAFSIGTDYRKVGVLTANVAAKVLLQKKPVKEVDILDISEGSIYVNSHSPVAAKIAPHGNYGIVRIP